MLVRFENPEIICEPLVYLSKGHHLLYLGQEQPSDVIIWFNRDQIEEADYRELFDWVNAHTRRRCVFRRAIPGQAC